VSTVAAGQRPDWEWYQRASDQVAADDLNAAEETIEGALVAGHLWRVSLLIAPTLQALRGRDRFEALASEARGRADRRHLEPFVITAAPRIQTHVAPLLLVLHGATGNALAELERWRPAIELGWIVAAGQSSQPATEDGFCWDPPRERVAQDLRVIAAQLPPHGRVVVAGFSQGAWIALNLGLEANILVAGSVVMIAPFAGPDPNLPAAWRRLKVSILVGENDDYRTPVELLAQQLTHHEHHVELEVIPDLGHAYPADCVARLPNLLRR
jgi:predicted esterase